MKKTKHNKRKKKRKGRERKVWKKKEIFWEMKKNKKRGELNWSLMTFNPDMNVTLVELWKRSKDWVNQIWIFTISLKLFARYCHPLFALFTFANSFKNIFNQSADSQSLFSFCSPTSLRLSNLYLSLLF